MNFGTWDDSIHESYEQISRIASGKAKVKAHVADLKCETAEYIGSRGEVYETTLNECTCMDFSTRRLPCKHIYSLADELGFVDDLPAFDKTEAEAFDVGAEIHKYKELYLKGVMSTEKFVRVAKALAKGL